MSGRYVLAIDQGTTSTRAILFDDEAKPCAVAQRELNQIYPAPGSVEHDPEEILRSVIETGREVLAGVGADAVAAVGITNQRETTVVWERATGRPLANAIVWQDRRTADLCAELRDEGWGAHVAEATGLIIDPYFSATKLAYLLRHVPGLEARATRGEACFGTIDSFLVFRLTGGLHATDASNAARTMLYDIRSGRWDERLLDRLGVPRAMLPEIRDTQGDYGATLPEYFGAGLQIRAVAGDQQAAAYGQACFRPGMLKATYGTGCFVLANTGREKVTSATRMLSTVFHQLAGVRSYALEGAIFMAGSTVQWLRDALGLIGSARESEALAVAANPKSGVYLVPAFQGLGAPFWDAEARGAVLGLTLAASKADLVAAGLEAVAFQTRDLLSAMRRDMAEGTIPVAPVLRTDGGMTSNAWFMQRLADILGERVEVALYPETTALGAAYHAGQAIGLYGDDAELESAWRPGARFEPIMGEAEREARYGGWLEAVARVRSRQSR
ncbi:glycerol kinase GlpK [Methyloceanibacter sp.]|uniref:glycerol kinase GlpK n=1 Tax=Methyloceanibacter sp. TaxID=1965321 RepID=UPI002D66A560|nr:glycerol kinase GlpK [Methyloceanibacter sp.]HZP08562.1 glycerol kinase GlpK [Methyloceanibacter sp.]